MSTLLEVRNLKKHYPIRKGLLSKQVGSVKAVDGVTMSVQRGKRWPWSASPAAANRRQGGRFFA